LIGFRWIIRVGLEPAGYFMCADVFAEFDDTTICPLMDLGGALLMATLSFTLIFTPI
jgi:hypothetical protein